MGERQNQKKKNKASCLPTLFGTVLTTEPFNLNAKNSQKFSGLANKKAIHLKSSKKGLSLANKSTKSGADRKPATQSKSVHLKRDAKRVARSIRNKTRAYRPDLKHMSLARSTALLRAKRMRKIGVKPQI